MIKQSTYSVLEQAKQLYSLSDIEHAIAKMAKKITLHYKDKEPLLLVVMNGALMTAGYLLPRLPFPMHVDYVHLSRYGNETTGGNVVWHHKPASVLTGRDIILVEDIVDEGVTLQILREYCLTEGANSVICATLTVKEGVEKVGPKAEFIGLSVPNEYIFGFGMDYKNYWRNLPAIYAVSEAK